MALGGGAALVAAVFIGWTGAILRRLQETEHSYTIIAVYCWFATLLGTIYFREIPNLFPSLGHPSPITLGYGLQPVREKNSDERKLF